MAGVAVVVVVPVVVVGGYGGPNRATGKQSESTYEPGLENRTQTKT